MAKHGALLFSHAFLVFFILGMSLLCKAIDHTERHVHIVYLGSLPHDEAYSSSNHHLRILERVVRGNPAANILTRSYNRSFNGFAAKLTDQEREKLATMEEVVSVFPSRTFQLQTTRSWDFMGFVENITRNATIESDVIVGVLDTGIWPESESFKDKAFAPVPKKWKGDCKGGQNFTCNNKIIGARVYTPDEPSARDQFGHGTHTASTAAGNVVKDVNFYGLAQGTARGGVPSSRIAAYKVCTVQGCTGDALLAAFDDAIADRVDIITISIGPNSAEPLERDEIAIGAFHAMDKGILTLNSAGNSGPVERTLCSLAPWILTVAASSIDRRLIDKVVLGNGRTFIGSSVNTFSLKGTNYPLIYGKDASSTCTESTAGMCAQDCLDSKLVKGKIVLCDRFRGNVQAHMAGALGSVLNTANNDVSFVVPLPATGLSNRDYDSVMSYLKTTKTPQANILKSEAIKDGNAPIVASFSSRGPNQIIPEIIKPDISAPGIDILAAFSPVAYLTGSPEDQRRVNYSILSGTSMSCPHAAGVAAYIKTFHPDWSPAAIKSSLMTTAKPMNNTSTSPGEFSHGSGHIDPVKALDPGLVYDASKQDYISFLCVLLHDTATVRRISGDNSTCPTSLKKGSPKDHNYPSLAANVTPVKPFTVTFHRRVKNVGLAKSTYKAKILGNPKVDIKVVPEILSFKSLNEEKAFDLSISGKGLPDGSYVSAEMVWSDETHTVRSPIVISSAELN